MRATSTAARSAVAAVVALISVAVIGGVVAAATKADFGLGANPTSQTVQRGQSGAYAISVSSSGGFSGSVTLRVSGLPTGANGCFSSASSSGCQPSLAVPAGSSASLVVTTSPTTPAATSSLTVTGTSGKTSHSLSLGLTVTAPQGTGFALSVSPAFASVAAGDLAAYSIAITRSAGFTGAVSLSVTGVPAGSVPTWLPQTVTGSTSTLQVDTSDQARADTYALTITATGGGQTQQATVTLQLVEPKKREFGISGGPVQPLVLGVAQPLDLLLSNPTKAMSVTNLTVTVVGTTVHGTSTPSSCSIDNFGVRQLTGAYPLLLPSGGPYRLSQLGVDAAHQPQVTLVNLPTNQDACKNVDVQLAFSGSGSGAA